MGHVHWSTEKGPVTSYSQVEPLQLIIGPTAIERGNYNALQEND